MTYRKLLTTLLIPCSSLLCHVTAQSGTVSTGGDASGSGGTSAYSVGQVDYTHFDGEDFHVSLGVQQPNVELMVSAEEPDEYIGISAFPNPTATLIELDIDATIF